MKTNLLAAAAGALFLLCGSASAAPVPQPPSARSQPSPEKIQLAFQLMTAIRIDQQVDLMLSAILPAMLEAAGDGLAESEKQALTASAREAFTAIMPEYKKAVATEYARLFSEGEMRDAIAFYTSPSGSAFLDKQPRLMNAGQDAMEDVLPKFREELQRRVCKKIKCTAANGLGAT